MILFFIVCCDVIWVLVFDVDFGSYMDKIRWRFVSIIYVNGLLILL